ncbi:flippase [Paraburkholderia sp. J67]|uniref:flippase n=1 Tax=Paraburkholderia sp. J67 TaxID=2805435 RepID=UPI002ABE5156|nr:flippase [Paraburkholderia sp. J67]
MTTKPSLKRNAIINFTGSVAPVIVSLVTVPMYLAHIGEARYGVLAIVWMLQGYFGYFDLGLAAATSNRIAQLADSTPAERESVLWTALALNAGFGLLGGVALYGLGHLLFAQFHFTPQLNAEVLAVLPWIACSVPLSTIAGVFSGALIGREQFAALNAVQFAGVLIFQVVPLLVAIAFKPDLQYVIGAAIAGGAFALLLKVVIVFRVFPLRFAAGPTRRWIKPLFSYGAWVTVTNLASPLLETADRLLIGSVLGPQAVSWYQVPFNLAIRVRILPGVISTTLFPRLSSLDSQSASALASRALRGLAAAMTPLIVFGIFLMQPFLTLWTGPVFASNATSIGEAILVGVWFNALAYIPYSHLQAIGRPDLVARFHALEILPFVGCLWWALHSAGLVGAALVWSGRMAIDMLLLFWAARFGAQLARHLVTPGLLVIAAFVVTLLVPWQTVAYFAAWAGLVGASLLWVLRVEPAVRARAAATMSTALSYRWRRS